MEQVKKRIVDIIEKLGFKPELIADEISKEFLFQTRKCKQCSKSFLPYNIKHVFCNDNCKLDWHNVNDGFDLDKFLKHKKSKENKNENAKPHNRTGEIRKCKLCGKSFTAYNVKNIFCDYACRMKWHEKNNGFDINTFLKRKK